MAQIAEDRRERGQRLLAQISNEMVRAQKQFFGKGPTEAKSYMLDDFLLVVMRGGMTTAEKTMLEFGHPDQVRAFRQLFENEMTDRLTTMVEELTGRKVLTYQSQVMFDPDLLVEMFVFDSEGEREHRAATTEGRLEADSSSEATNADVLDEPSGSGQRSAGGGSAGTDEATLPGGAPPAGEAGGTPRDGSPDHPQVDVGIYVRPLGSSLPLGFFAFGTGIFLLGVSALGWTPVAQAPDIGRLLLTFVAPLEIAAAIIAFLARDTAGATAFAVFSGYWITVGTTMLTAVPGSTSDTAGFFFLVLTAVIALLAVVALPGKPLIGLILVLATVRTALAAAYQLGASQDVDRVGGAVALVIAALALYGGLAFLLEDVRRRAVLPVFRRGEAKKSMEGDLSEQLDRLADEAGVRRQL